MSLLEVSDLVVSYPIRKRFLRPNIYLDAVDRVSFEMSEGETFGLVGESGSGKSSIGRSILGLEKFNKGSITLDGEKYGYDNQKRSQHFKRNVQMIFQNSYSSFNPKKKILDIITEPLKNLTSLTHQDQRKRAIELLEIMKLSESDLEKFPDEFSGGQLQRIGVARAVATNPKLIIADEPVSALDLSVQAEVLNYMKLIQVEYKVSYLFISHDLSVVQHMCDQLAIMHKGRFVEMGSREAVYNNSTHIYTKQLLAAVPGSLSNEELDKRASVFAEYQQSKNNMYNQNGRVHDLYRLSENHLVSGKTEDKLDERAFK